MERLVKTRTSEEVMSLPPTRATPSTPSAARATMAFTTPFAILMPEMLSSFSAM